MIGAKWFGSIVKECVVKNMFTSGDKHVGIFQSISSNFPLRIIPP